MADYTFYTVAMSRGQIARWALHEAGADYEQVLVDWANRPGELAAANPMNKVPVLIHHAAEGDRVITECAGICAYLADVHPEAGLLPQPHEKADYYRWLFFAAGPLEQAVISRAMGWEVPEGKSGMAGFGTYERTIAVMDGLLSGRDWICGARFTMADVYVGSQIDWGLNFGSIPPEPSFVAYADRLRTRAGYQAAKAIDRDLIKAAKG
ncbi:MAG: glutathione S-transferase family protein [Novosphingobium sp.]|nr:glutathione S-transferase family protein [Novosphingobium sp.]